MFRLLLISSQHVVLYVLLYQQLRRYCLPFLVRRKLLFSLVKCLNVGQCSSCKGCLFRFISPSCCNYSYPNIDNSRSLDATSLKLHMLPRLVKNVVNCYSLRLRFGGQYTVTTIVTRLCQSSTTTSTYILFGGCQHSV